MADIFSSSPILVTLMMEALLSPKRQFLQGPYGVTSQKTAFFNKTLTKAFGTHFQFLAGKHSL
jgi:hypothetical protein